MTLYLLCKEVFHLLSLVNGIFATNKFQRIPIFTYLSSQRTRRQLRRSKTEPQHHLVFHLNKMTNGLLFWVRMNTLLNRDTQLFLQDVQLKEPRH